MCGSSDLGVRAVKGITNLVEELHAAIVNVSSPLAGKKARPKQTDGIPHMVYRSVRGVTQWVGWGLDQGLAAAQNPVVNKLLAPATKNFMPI